MHSTCEKKKEINNISATSSAMSAKKKKKTALENLLQQNRSILQRFHRLTEQRTNIRCVLCHQPTLV